ncbi:PepSY domain-containing protein [Pseudomonas sp. ISL-88]|uniref:PepSY domain-containing protein n=1 Tax=Bacteria TaxID=2 RepID=UPI001BE7A114|nr:MULTISPECIES: PepSY domain-containing protein [Bacteria]MBT2713801.1 PepSY domain-containing protein [Pseudomonas sp. ISL-88]
MARAKAESFALNHCKGVVKSSKMKTENGVSVYVVSIFGQDGKLHTLHMDDKSGKVLKEDVKKKQVIIAAEKAHSIALSNCKGTVKSSEMKKENGTRVYIVKITAQNHTEQTVKVNAENGSICK